MFLHILPTRIHRYSLKIRATLGLGVITLVLFFLLVLTGIALMVYYKPSTDQAYDSMKEIRYVVPTGRFMRNIHRWAAHAMVACVILHMARAFYTAAYKAPRQFNWVVGMMLFVLTLGLSFTGYLLPWDQLAYLGGDDRLGDRPLAARSDGCAGHHLVVRHRRLSQAAAVGRQPAWGRKR